VRAAWTEVDPLINRQLTELHPAECKEILQMDPELSAEVEKLTAEDAVLVKEHKSLGRFIAELSQVAPLVEPDERKVKDGPAKLVDTGIAFVARLKKQQVVLRTWFQEAFNRDRGTAD
jgi:hypothetical protein